MITLFYKDYGDGEPGSLKAMSNAINAATELCQTIRKTIYVYATPFGDQSIQYSLRTDDEIIDPSSPHIVHAELHEPIFAEIAHCLECGIDFILSNKRKKCCSDSCRAKYFRKQLLLINQE